MSNSVIKLLLYKPGIMNAYPTELHRPFPYGYAKIKTCLLPLLECENLEHVSVLFKGKNADMFVSETGALDGAALNIAATEIYQAYGRSNGKDMSSAACIYGNAIVTETRIWR